MLDLLFEQIARPEYAVRFKWEPGSVAFWDNRAALHLAPRDFEHVAGDRVLHRITLVGDVPVGTDGVASESLAGEFFGAADMATVVSRLAATGSDPGRRGRARRPESGGQEGQRGTTPSAPGAAAARAGAARRAVAAPVDDGCFDPRTFRRPPGWFAPPTELIADGSLQEHLSTSLFRVGYGLVFGIASDWAWP